MNFYVIVWIETVRATLWPLHREMTAYAMREFGGHAMVLVALQSVLGVVFAVALLWAVGQYCKKCMLQIAPQRIVERHARLTEFFLDRGYWLALVMWLPASFMFGIAFGMFDVPIRRVLKLAAAGASLFYGYQFLV